MMMMANQEAWQIAISSTGSSAAVRDLQSIAGAASQAEAAVNRMNGVMGKKVTNLNAYSQAKQAMGSTAAGTQQLTASIARLDAEMFKNGLATRTLVQHMTGLNSTQKKLQNESSKTAKSFNLLGTAMATATTYFGARQIIETADAYTSLSNRLKLVSTSQANLNTLMDETYNIAQRTRTDWNATANLYSKVANAAKGLGKSQQDIAKFTELTNKAIALSGISSREASAGLIQLAQAIGSGRFAGDELKSIFENMPRFRDAIVEATGKTTEQLRKMGAEGELTSKMLMDAIVSQADTINKEYTQIESTVSAAFQTLTTGAQKYIGELNSATGVGSLFAKGLIVLGNNFSLVGNSLIVLTAGVVAYQLAVNGVSIALKSAAIAQVAFNFVATANPYALALTALVALTAGVIIFSDKIKVGESGIYNLRDVAQVAFQAMTGNVNGFGTTLAEEIGKAVNLSIKDIRRLEDAFDWIGSIGEKFKDLGNWMGDKASGNFEARRAGRHLFKNDRQFQLSGDQKDLLNMLEQHAGDVGLDELLLRKGGSQKAVSITDATRAKNSKVGSPTSYHKQAMALDLGISDDILPDPKILMLMERIANDPNVKEFFAPPKLVDAFNKRYNKENYAHAPKLDPYDARHFHIAFAKKNVREQLQANKKANAPLSDVKSSLAPPVADDKASKAAAKAAKEAAKQAADRQKLYEETVRDSRQQLGLLSQEADQRQKLNSIYQIENQWKDIGGKLDDKRYAEMKQGIVTLENATRADETRNRILGQFVEPAKQARAELVQLDKLYKSGTIKADQYKVKQHELNESMLKLSPKSDALREYNRQLEDLVLEMDALAQPAEFRGIFADVAKQQRDAERNGTAGFISKEKIDEQIALRKSLQDASRITAIEDEYGDARQNQIRDFGERLSVLTKVYKDGKMAKEDYLRATIEIQGAQQRFEPDQQYASRLAAMSGLQLGLHDLRMTTDDIVDTMAQRTVDAFVSMEDALLGFVQTGKFEFKDMANSIIADIARIAIRQAITTPIADALGGAVAGMRQGASRTGAAMAGVGGGGGGGFASFLGQVAGSFVNLGRNAVGGSYKIPGGGSTDSVNAIMQVTPGERVTVTPPGTKRSNSGGGDGSNVIINIIGTTAPVETKKRKDSQGNNIIDVIIKAVDDRMNQSAGDTTSRFGRTMQNAYRLTPAIGGA